VSGVVGFSGNSTETGTGVGSVTRAQSGATFAGGTTLTLNARTLDLLGSSTTQLPTNTNNTNDFNDTINLNNGSSLIVETGATFTDATTSGGGSALVIQSTSGTAGTVTNSGTWQKTGNSSGNDTISVGFTNAGLISVQQGTLHLLGTLTNLAGGSLFVQNATIELAAVSGGTNVSFGGTSGVLQLDSTVSSAQSAAVSATSSGAAVTITGNGSVTSTSADAIDVTSSGGNVSVTPAGAITGGQSGISIDENGVGNITVTASGAGQSVVGQSGQGIFAEESASASGSILINGTDNVTGTGNTDSGILAEILNAANNNNIIVSQTGNISGGFDGIRAFTDGNGNVTVTTGPSITISGSQLFGIVALSFGTGSLSVTTTTNDIVTSVGAGLVAQSDATSLPQADASSISITAVGTINSGTTLTPANVVPAGIIAGYAGATSGSGTPNPNVFGNVFVTNSANINAAGGDGIRAFNFGSGNITVKDQPSTTITAPGRFGITASVFGGGNISISTATGDIINSGSSGIQVTDNGTVVPATSTVSVTAFGTINSGFVPTGGGNGVPSGISAGYNGGSGTTNTNVQGNVIVDSSATINAALGFGVGLFNFGVGNLTATLESSSAIVAPTTGVNAFAQGGGNVSITNHGTVTVATGTGISTGNGNGVANSASGVISVTNSGTISALGSLDKSVIQINNDSTQAATFTNSGTVASQLFSTSPLNQALAVFNGSSTVNNSGTITGNVNLATATFNNNSGGIWNVDGSNTFGGGTINNAGTINISDVAIFTTSGTLGFDNASAVNLLADSFAFIGGPVAGINGTSGTFSIGDFSTLEFGNSVAAGQTVSFVDGNALLTLDSPSTFNATIANLAIGDTILLQGITIPNSSDISISGPITPGGSIYDLTITEANSQILTYQIEFQTGVSPPGVTFSLLAPDLIQLVPSTATLITGSSGPLSESPSTQQFYILSNATISGTGGVGFNVASTDSTPGDFLTVEITQTSSISMSGTSTGVNLTTAGANIALVNAGSITSTGGPGINTNSGTGSTIIVAYGNVSGASNGINANTSGGGQISIGVEPGVTVTGTGAGTVSNPGFAISAGSLGGNVIVDTSSGDILNSGSSGINAQDRAASLAQASNSSISIETSGTINSGATPPSSGNEPGGIKVGYNGGSGPTTAVFGNVIINNFANITAAGGLGIFAFNDGVGNIDVTDNSSTTITATAAGTTTPGSAQFGIGAFGFESGNTTVSMGPGSTINSGSAGIEAVNQATAIPAAQTSTVTVVALGSTNSGANSGNSNTTPAGIVAGFNGGGTNTFNANVNGNVFVDFDGTINSAAGPGIRTFDEGIGSVTVNVGNGASITALHSSTAASDNAPYGIGAFTFGPGDITVTTSNGATINSGSAGIQAISQATAITAAADAFITITTSGTIDSGTILNNAGSEPSGISAGFLGGTVATANLNVNGIVTVNNAANIAAAAGDGIHAFNEGNGDVRVNEAAATVTGANTGIFASIEGGGSGNVSVNIGAGANVTGTSNDGIFASSTGTGDISVMNNGNVTGTAAAVDATTTSTGAVTIDNFGNLVGEVISYNASFANEPGADWSFNGASVFTGTSILTNAGLIESNGTSSITGLSGTTNTGTIEAESGSLKIAGPVTGAGAAIIVSGTMEFAAASDAHVQFDTGPSTSAKLLLDDVAHFTGTVTGFAPGDTIDLVGISPSSVSVSNSGGLHVNYGTGSFALLGNYDPAGFSVISDGSGGTDIVWDHQAPFILTNNFTVTNNSNGTTTISGLQISDGDPGVTSVSIAATTAGAASGTSISPATDTGSLASINTILATGVTYNPGTTPPSSDMVRLNATDNFGASETFNFVFNQSNSNTGVHLVGTSGNDVIFATGGSDVLTGGGGQDQFVFKPTGGSNPVQHVITDFNAATDTLDLRQFAGISSSALPTGLQVGNDTLITLDSQDSLLLKNVTASSLHASDFIVHP
jgi:RTX calcium-binding nonapeptide repeat (4 copies)